MSSNFQPSVTDKTWMTTTCQRMCSSISYVRVVTTQFWNSVSISSQVTIPTNVVRMWNLGEVQELWDQISSIFRRNRESEIFFSIERRQISNTLWSSSRINLTAFGIRSYWILFVSLCEICHDNFSISITMSGTLGIYSLVKSKEWSHLQSFESGKIFPYDSKSDIASVNNSSCRLWPYSWWSVNLLSGWAPEKRQGIKRRHI